MVDVDKVILGGQYMDERGTISFVNDFDMTVIKRFYILQHPDINIVRAWQGHKIENKWFYCVSGSFLLNVVNIDNWEHPSPDLAVISYHLKSDSPSVYCVTAGHVTGIKALEPNASLMVFSDLTINESKDDDIRFDKNKWFNWNSV
jgi:dTDP-4-dehydrorhamnose 3,5-epimerase